MGELGSSNSAGSSKRSHGSEKSSRGSLNSSGGASIRGSSTSTQEHSQEPFYSYKEKVIQLCRDIGKGEPFQVLRMKGGSYNRIIGLEFASPRKQDYILRIPRNGTEFDKSEDIKDQVAILLYVSQFVPVASVAAYDSTQNNAIASAYVLQERLPGVVMENSFYNLPLAEKLQVTTKVAELMIKMESIKLAAPGRVVADDDVPTLQHQPPSSPKPIKILGYRSARYGSSAQFPALQKADFAPLMLAMLEHRKQSFILKDEPWMVEKVETLQKIVSQMEQAGLVRTTDKDCTLWHWDFAARNIMISRPSTASVSPAAQASPAPNICKHKIQIRVNDPSGNNHKHSVDVALEDLSASRCRHVVKVEVENLTGTTYYHTVEIIQNEESRKETRKLTLAPATVSEDVMERKVVSREIDGATKGQWAISGVLDWDGILSVPLVLARRPPIWLWCNEKERSSAWSGNLDVPPARELTQDELLIKAHFDQIMAKASPSYIEDAYFRGPWLRRLARFALFGFSEFGCFERYDSFVKDWEEYVSSINHERVKSSDSENDTDEEEAEDTHEDEDEDGEEAENRTDDPEHGDDSGGENPPEDSVVEANMEDALATHQLA
jgi:hypothetical protein